MKQKSQNYGSCFKELRQLAAFKYKDLEAIMSKTGIVKFENGTSNISFEKLAELLKFMGYTLSDFMYLEKVELMKFMGKSFISFATSKAIVMIFLFQLV